ncbi:MAG TPA: protein kinase [Gemmataceae bacterium]|nr:protein kinase [Gemmataceae bacterium]
MNTEHPTVTQAGTDAGLSDHTPSVVPPPTPSPPLALDGFPGYEILEELGRGGMGVVFKARQIGLDRVVALKMILSGAFAGHEEVQRFRIEAEAVARLAHPHIVQIHEIGECQGRPFFSLEFCAGGGLDRKLNGTPLPPTEAAALVEKLARAVAAAHKQHVVHRDLKPANVLLTADGEPKITDFGLAKKLDDAGRTPSGAVLGTPSYMAPEQAQGRPVGPACDVYALGAILYECLTGRPPFKAAAPVDTVLQVIESEPAPPRQLQPKTPRDLDTICLKCLQKQPSQRYAGAGELADDLGRFLESKPIHARPISLPGRLTKWAKRRPTAAALLAALVLLLAAGSAALGLYLKMAAEERDHAAAERARIDKEVADFEAAAEDQRLQGRYGDAAATLGKAAPLLGERPDRADALKRLEAQRDQFGRLDEFLRNSDRAWFAAGEEHGEEVRAACEKALKCYDVLERPDWRTNGPAANMPADRVGPVQQEVHRQLLLLAAMRIKEGVVLLKSQPAAWEKIKAQADAAQAAVDRAREMEEQGVVEPSKCAAILTTGAKGLANPLGSVLSSLTPGTSPGGAYKPADVSAEDAFFLGVMHVYLAKHMNDPLAQWTLSRGPREFDYVHPRGTAVAMLRRAVQKDSQQYWASFMLGRVLQFAPPGGKADYQGAWDAFTDCIALRPDYSRGYEQRGLTLVLQSLETADESERKGMLEGAREDFDKALALAPNDPSTWWVRGQMFQLLNDAPDAIVAYSRALDLLSDVQDMVSWRNQLDDPRRLVHEVLTQNPHDRNALHLSEQLDRAGQP